MHYLPWALAIFVAIVFVQSLFFKFTNSFETQHIFTTIGDWMGSIGLPAFITSGFAAWGGYTVGSVELIASILLIMRRTQALGALIGFFVISGAIFFHLFTPLGVSVVIDEAGNRDGGQLFALAVGVFISTILIMWLRRGESAEYLRLES
ncbi:MAG: DoxX family membrane protein [Gammaproteobacteria bacterium]|nr:DoxX family membrane protein [Gammaproteobacteria bacterium]